jgi:hypothetical protein
VFAALRVPLQYNTIRSIKNAVSFLSPAGSRELAVLLSKVRRRTDRYSFPLELPWQEIETFDPLLHVVAE